MMKRTWNAIKNPFHRQTIEETQLQDDYPTDVDSEFTDDEQRRQEWQRHIKRRATIATEGVTNCGISDNAGLKDSGNKLMNDKWDLASEYSVSFPSDSTIIDAFKEKQNSRARPFMPSNEREINSYKAYIIDERQRNQIKRRVSLCPQTERGGHDSYSGRGDMFNLPDEKSSVRDVVNGLEKDQRRRRDSIYPHGMVANNLLLRRESSDRESDSGRSSFKRKVRKQIKQRKRAQPISPDESDIESIELKSPKYTVNLTMDEIRDMIKKDVSSAVKTISGKNVKKNTTRQCDSPFESLSTESETIFSGSSQSTDTQLGGLLQKQMNAQLDKDKLSGQRRSSVAFGRSMVPDNTASNLVHTNALFQPISSSPSFHNEQPPQIIIHDASKQPQILMQGSSQLQDANHLCIPQVTFNMSDTHSTASSGFQFPSINTPRRNSIIVPSAQRPSILPNDVTGNFDPFDPYGMKIFANTTAHLSPSVLNTVDPMAGCGIQVPENPFNTADSFGIPQDSFNRLRMRRHTMAAALNPLNLSIDPLDQFSASPLISRRSVQPSTDPRLDQLDSILKTLDANLNNSEKTDTGIKNQESTSKNTTESNSQKKANEKEARPLTIAEQIEALTKKTKKPLKPGQMGLTGCARAILIIINILFLLVGAGSLGVGIWMLMDPNIETYFDILNVNNNNQDFKMICYIMGGIGGVILFIGFMGCCGTIRSSKIMLSVFITVTAVIILTEAGLGTILYINKDSTTAIPVLSALISELGVTLREQLTKSLIEKYDPETTIGSAWDLVQIQGECCGSNGPDDYIISAWKNTSNDNDISLPISCCVLISKDVKAPEPSNMLLCQTKTTGFYHDTGCFDALLGWFQKNSSYLVAVVIAVLAIEVFSLFFAIAICRKAHKDVLKYKDTPGIR